MAQPPAMCLNVEEMGCVLNEVFACLIFQGQELLDDYVALSFAEMKAKMEDYQTPLGRRQFFYPFFVQEGTRFPRPSTKEEYMDWATRPGKVADPYQRAQRRLDEQTSLQCRRILSPPFRKCGLLYEMARVNNLTGRCTSGPTPLWT